MRIFTEAPDQLPPPPSGPNEGLVNTRFARQRREGLDALIPMVRISGSGFLFPRPLGITKRILMGK